MLLPNPLKHYPVYKAEILYADNAVGCVEGQGEAGDVYVPDRDMEVRAVAVTGCDAGKHPCGTKLWVDGEWVEYYGDWIANLSKEVEEGDEGEAEDDEDDEDDEAVKWEEDKQFDDDEAYKYGHRKDEDFMG